LEGCEWGGFDENDLTAGATPSMHHAPPSQPTHTRTLTQLITYTLRSQAHLSLVLPPPSKHRSLCVSSSSSPPALPPSLPSFIHHTEVSTCQPCPTSTTWSPRPRARSSYTPPLGPSTLSYGLGKRRWRAGTTLFCRKGVMGWCGRGRLRGPLPSTLLLLSFRFC